MCMSLWRKRSAWAPEKEFLSAYGQNKIGIPYKLISPTRGRNARFAGIDICMTDKCMMIDSDTAMRDACWTRMMPKSMVMLIMLQMTGFGKLCMMLYFV